MTSIDRPTTTGTDRWDDDLTNSWIDRDVASVWHGFTQMSAYRDNQPVIVERAEGRELIDVAGRRYFDAISSLWVATLGHHLPELDQAVRDQLDRVAHTTQLGNGNRVVIEFAEALRPRLPMDDPRLMFASDGAAAVEQALKIAFQYWTNQGIDDRTTFLAFGGAYHGDTIGSLSLGAGGFGTDVYDPLRFSTVHSPTPGTAGWVEATVDLIARHADELAGVIIEPLCQGASGIHPSRPEEVAAIAAACTEHGVLLICDEVAVGFGRTGTLFASEQCGITPDIMALGKGISGGYLPLSATASSARVADAFLGADLGPRTFYHGHSYAGNALACAVALRHLELIDEWDVLENVVARSAELGEQLTARIAAHPSVREARHCGLMAGIELDPPSDDLRWGRRVSAACIRRGVLIRPLGDVVVLVPPLTTTASELTMVIDTVEAALDEVRAGWSESDA